MSLNAVDGKQILGRGRAPSLRAVALAMVVGLVVASCGGSDEATSSVVDETVANAPSTALDSEEQVADRCVPAGQVVMGTVFEVAGLDPAVSFGSGQAGQSELHALYDALMRYVPESGVYEPHLAESLTSNEDRTSWTLTLRPDARFGNGDPVTAGDVKFSLERLAATTRFAAGQVQEFTSLEVLDDQTLVIGTRSPNGQVPYTLSGEAGMVVSEAVATELGDEFARNPEGGGAGPFELERYAPGEELVLKVKADYWGDTPCVERLVFKPLGGSQLNFDALQNGEIDIAFLEDDPQVIEEARAAGLEAYSSAAAGGSMLNMNNREGRPTALPEVRMAIALAIDTDLINDRLFEGTGRTGKTISSEGQPMWPDVPGLPFDPDQARRLTEDAIDGGWDGELNMVFSNSAFETELSILLEGMLENVGMTVNRENLDPGAALDRLLQPPYDYDIARAQLAVLDTGGFARLNQFLCDSVRNRTGYCSPDMDEAILDLVAASGPAEEAEAFGQIQTIWNTDVPSLPVVTSTWFIAATDQVSGLEFTTEASILWNSVEVAR